LIKNGTLVTMDPRRRVIEHGALAIAGGRIVDLGTAQDPIVRQKADHVIDASRMVVMPGLIDGHAHAGHGLVKTLGAGW
jgi:5-methylthioadenosine/S-adenosylhomocysteine deaminase